MTEQPLTDSQARRMLAATQPVYQRLTEIKADLTGQRGRPVTYIEVLEAVLDVYDEVTG